MTQREQYIMSQSQTTRAYKLRPGQEHWAVVQGNRLQFIGGTKQDTVELTEDQYKNFKDKFFDPDARGDEAADADTEAQRVADSNAQAAATAPLSAPVAETEKAGIGDLNAGRNDPNNPQGGGPGSLKTDKTADNAPGATGTLPGGPTPPVTPAAQPAGGKP